MDGTTVEPQTLVPPDISITTDAAAKKAVDAVHATITMTFTKELEIWRANKAKVFSWIINSVEPRIALTLRTFTSVAAIWIHLEKVYAKANSARLFDHEYELAKLTQGDRDINTFLHRDTWLMDGTRFTLDVYVICCGK
ncbi:hypothetical protein LINPERHAP2_LOCUS35862 [Linum perenne]